MGQDLRSQVDIGRATLDREGTDRKSTRLNSSHSQISYAVFCLKKKKNKYLLYFNRTIYTYIILPHLFYAHRFPFLTPAIASSPIACTLLVILITTLSASTAFHW